MTEEWSGDPNAHGLDTADKYLGWRTFLRNHAEGIAAMDLFVVPTVSFRLLYCLLIIGNSLGRRSPPPHFATLVCPTSMPSFKSSPCILGAPHKEFSMLICRIRRRISNDMVGRPGRHLDFQRQYNRNPARCQRMTVSGLTIARALYAFGNDRQAVANTSLSIVPKRSLFGALRRSTLICCLNTSSSATRAARDRNRSVTIPAMRRTQVQHRAPASPVAEWIANQLTEAVGWEQAPRYLIRDRNAAYGGTSANSVVRGD